MEIKPNQTSVVKHILEQAQCGPQNGSSLFTSELAQQHISIQHLDFVIMQLQISGSLHKTDDGRFITTPAGDAFLTSITQHIVIN